MSPGAGVWQVTPTSLLPTSSNPGLVTESFSDFRAVAALSELPDRYQADATRFNDNGADWRPIRFRLTGQGVTASGTASAEYFEAPLSNPGQTAGTGQFYTRPHSQSVPGVEVESPGYGISALYMEWYVPERIPQEWINRMAQTPPDPPGLPVRLVADLSNGDQARWEPQRQFSNRGAWTAEYGGESFSGTGDSGGEGRPRITWEGHLPPGGAPVWDGITRTGVRARDRMVTRLPVTQLYTVLLGGNYQSSDLLGPPRETLTVEADLPGLGRFEVHAPDDSVTSGGHRDLLVGGASMTLAGNPLSGNSWAILRRRGGELNLLTLGAGALTVHRPTGAFSLPVGGTWLESDLTQGQHPDHVRLIGERAFILTGFDAFRDLEPGERPRRLEGLEEADRLEGAEPAGISIVAEVPLPTLTTAGLPRYGREPRVLFHSDPEVIWPWSTPRLQDAEDERGLGTEVTQPAPVLFPGAGPVVIVGRARGGEPEDGGNWTWSSEYDGSHSWRPFTQLWPDGAPGTFEIDAEVEHLAAYAPFREIIEG
ncbi:hypothetical protein [Deinococcus sedimenti]|uniref:hypothetical protein n=1 Tax=Deinococcus sedimenti TaxID=1867090 RepID=UPI00166F086F|nr:hypothetical protein [Deinococcus sedimenti]